MEEEEASLLAELRAISNRSGAGSRFSAGSDQQQQPPSNEDSFYTPRSSPPRTSPTLSETSGGSSGKKDDGWWIQRQNEADAADGGRLSPFPKTSPRTPTRKKPDGGGSGFGEFNSSAVPNSNRYRAEDLSAAESAAKLSIGGVESPSSALPWRRKSSGGRSSPSSKVAASVQLWDDTKQRASGGSSPVEPTLKQLRSNSQNALDRSMPLIRTPTRSPTPTAEEQQKSPSSSMFGSWLRRPPSPAAVEGLPREGAVANIVGESNASFSAKADVPPWKRNLKSANVPRAPPSPHSLGPHSVGESPVSSPDKGALPPWRPRTSQRSSPRSPPLYAAASASSSESPSVPSDEKNTPSPPADNIPPWKRRLKNRSASARASPTSDSSQDSSRPPRKASVKWIKSDGDQSPISSPVTAGNRERFFFTPRGSDDDSLGSSSKGSKRSLYGDTSWMTPRTSHLENEATAKEDAELIRELRSISRKFSDRFGSKDEEEASKEQVTDGEVKPSGSAMKAGGFKNDMSSLPKTFQGDRGGDAQDEELLKQLRAISSKSASDRFASEDDEGAEESLPPLKRTSESRKPQNDTVVVTGTKSKLGGVAEDKPEDEMDSKAVARPKIDMYAKTSQGDRGGDAHDEELLKELRAISSNVADRFATNEEVGGNPSLPSSPPEAVRAPAPTETRTATTAPNGTTTKTKPLPPWKRKSTRPKKKTTSDDDDVMLVSRQPKPTAVPILDEGVKVGERTGAFSNDMDTLPKTFQGDRGGDAHDEELLKELMAISSKSTSADRFASNDGDEDVPDTAVATNPAPENEVSPLPSWKRKSSSTTATDVGDPVVGEPKVQEDNTESREIPTRSSTDVGFTNDMSLPKTFQGERGGDAHDEDLLRELMAISSKSASSDRFASEGGEEEGQHTHTKSTRPTDDCTEEPIEERKDSSLPPWKRKSKQAKMADPAGDDVVVATRKDSSGVAENHEPSSSSRSDPGPTMSPKPRFTDDMGALPKTFQGDRGGDANDEDLLKELMAISSNSKSADRFAANDEEELSAPVSNAETNTFLVQEEKKDETSLPPWKRKSKQAKKRRPVTMETTANEELAVQDASSGRSSNNMSSLPNTFQGDRGGDAHDEELLKELMAISSNSKSAERFASNEDDDEHAPAMEAEAAVVPSEEPVPSPKKDGGLPPWKRKSKQPEKSSNWTDDLVFPTKTNDVVPEPTSEPRFTNDMGSLPKTFQGDRGGVAHDEDLLKELMAISSKSTSADRFAHNEDDEQVAAAGASVDPIENTAEPQLRIETAKESLPPWKRKARQGKTNDARDDVVVAAPQKIVSNGHGRSESATQQESMFANDMSSLPKTFQGERGGDAHDEDLLKELMAISSKSTSADRFAPAEEDDEQVAAAMTASNVAGRPPEIPKEQDVQLPPWKRKSRQPKQPNPMEDVVVSATKPGLGSSSLDEPTPEPKFSNDMQALPKTFQGDRGGDAHDEDLLRELQAISGKTASADRFASNDGYDGLDSAPPKQPQPVKPKKSSPRKKWKQKKKQESLSSIKTEEDVGGEGQQPHVSHVQPKFQDRSSLPKTFQGERGGDAHDEDLLRELMAISSKSSVVDRFASNDEEPTEEAALASQQPSNPSAPKKKDSSVPPWKRSGKQAAKTNNETVLVTKSERERNVRSKSTKPDSMPPWKRKTSQTATTIENRSTDVSESPPTMFTAGRADEGRFMKQDPMPFTFQGDRGGKAEDEDLLRELMAISTKASSGDRFAEGNEGSGDHDVEAVAPAPTKPPKPRERRADAPPPSAPVPPSPIQGSAPQGEDQEISVSLADFPESLKDKNWRVRKASYELLSETLSEAIGDDRAGMVSSDSVLRGLDEQVPSMMADKNANALDAALQFGVMYADHCSGAANAEGASSIVASVIKGGGFASSRQSTVKLCSSLVLKLMEVGEDSTSLHAVVEVLLDKGLKSRKPKEVTATSAAILDATLDFGAGSLPLAAVKAAVPKTLSHSKAIVRDNGIKIIAELCRALGSKGPLQEIIDGMKKAQVGQLDSLLEEQPAATPPRVGLRYLKQTDGNNGGAPADALAALEEQSKELEAKRFAARPAVNLLQELPKTEYSTRILLAKWSEKVAALDVVLSTGGERPYKLVQPSSSVNYGPLIADMRKLMTHTHYLVSSRSMQVISMLAEGVGERLFPNLRPLLVSVIEFSKDKKLTNAAAGCLDSMFGNVLSLDHILDKEDALSHVTDERKQKNVLVRKSALEFLSRCINRGESAGKRGALTADNVKKAAVLCVQKLHDSDATVRKAASETIRCIKQHQAPDIASIGEKTVKSIQSEHPRIYKSLQGSKDAKPKEAMAASPRRKTREENESRVAPSTPKKRAAAPSSRQPKQKEAISCHEQEGHSDDVDESERIVAALGIPKWDAEEDDGGIRDGLRSSKWHLRQNAVNSLSTFCRSMEELPPTSALLSLVKARTREFKESNFNVAKSIIMLFSALSEIHATHVARFPSWASTSGTTLAVEKISDKKLAAVSAALLTNLCVVENPSTIIGVALAKMESLRSPAANEAFMVWVTSVIADFGAQVVAPAAQEVGSYLVKQAESTNAKVRKASLGAFGRLHRELGPAFGALALSFSNSSKESLEVCFSKNPFDPALQGGEKQRTCVVLNASDGSSGDGAEIATGVEVPKLDPLADLGREILDKLETKKDKTSWKVRKEALDDIAAYVKRCNGLLLTDPPQLKFLVDLLRGLRERLSDSQSNLKPVAARCIGSILNKSEKTAQAKLGKVVYAPLFGTAMNDNRKPMRDASLEALKDGTEASQLEGGGVNVLAMEPLIVGFVAQLSESGSKAVGLPDVLIFIARLAPEMPNLDKILGVRAQPVGEKFAPLIIDCLSSSKGETRGKAEEVVSRFVEADAISAASLRKALERLKPATQRTVAHVLEKLIGPTSSSKSEKENLPSPRRTTQTKPRPRPKGGLSRSSSARDSFRASKSRRSIAQPEPTPPSDVEEDSSVEGTPFLTGSRQKRPSSKLSWPEFPEVPTQTHYSALRKHWSASLTHSAARALFPEGGIRKQDDSSQGCDVLMGVLDSNSTDVDLLLDNLDFIFRWLVVALCSRETTSGLQSLLSCIASLMKYLQKINCVVPEQETMILIPYVVEHAGLAKGRFKEIFGGVLSTIQLSGIVPSKTFGSIVCVSVIERTSNSKARVLSMQLCTGIVDEFGLSGIGKKGVLLAAKALSEESLSDVRTASLDLLEIVLSKMNGDIDRLARICGSSNLSDKARSLLEERWSRRSAPTGLKKSQSSRGKNLIQSPRSRATTKKSQTDEPTEEEHQSAQENQKESFKLDLRLGKSVSGDDVDDGKEIQAQDSGPGALVGPFSFSFDSKTAESSPSAQDIPEQSSASYDSNDIRVANSGEESTTSSQGGQTASLRARLMKIRELQLKSSNSLQETVSTDNNAEKEARENRQPVQPKKEPRAQDALDALEQLLSRQPPIVEDDEHMRLCVDLLKGFHSAVTNADGSSSSLRREISRNTTVVVSRLTEVIGFAFICGEEEKDAGISVSILSVALATLMALFRDEGLSQRVSQDALIMLIREAGKGLLDSRLAVSSQYASNLDESTSSQMVRAINKLAVQAATGSRRNDALHALLILHRRLTLEDTESPAETAFNSRLSRIVTKLFAKVVKAEEALADPFSDASVDIMSLLLSVESMLGGIATDTRRSHADARSNCEGLAQSMIDALVRAHGGRYIRETIGELDIDPESSHVGRLLQPVVEEVPPAPPPVNATPRQRTPSPARASMDVATLVSKVASAGSDEERRVAVANLRRYREEHGSQGLDEHLSAVSDTFRTFVLQQLTSSAPSSPMRTKPDRSLAMTERLRSLRLKLDATEAAVKTGGRPSGTSPSRKRSPSPRRPLEASSGEAQSSSPQRRVQSPPKTTTSPKPKSPPRNNPPKNNPPRPPLPVLPRSASSEQVSSPPRDRSRSPPSAMSKAHSRVDGRPAGSSLPSSPATNLRSSNAQTSSSPSRRSPSPTSNRRLSRLPTPRSRTPMASPTKPALKKSASGLLPPTSNLRARLAEAQQLRKTRSGLGLPNPGLASGATSSSGGAAASLRARLEAVRRQQQNS